MRLHVEHVTRYAYARPVTLHRHRLVLRPREGHDLRVERMDLTLTPASNVEWVRDVFGNSVALVDFLEPAAELCIVNDIVLEWPSSFTTRPPHEPWHVPFPPQYDPLESAVTAVYSQPTYLDDVPALQAWLKTEPAEDPLDAKGAMLALCQRIHAAIGYQRRTEKGTQSPAQTLTLKTGSCRDMATLLMEAARASGVAARFASGYLHGRASMAGEASTHAWAEVYLPTLGWRGFDPTIGDLTGACHIVTGVSTHPRGVMPVSGAFTGAPGDYLGLTVTVKTAVLDDPPSPAAQRPPANDSGVSPPPGR
jgi:transglutaminase-like putative cysteine protease